MQGSFSFQEGLRILARNMLLGLTAWTVLVGGSLVWNIANEVSQIQEMARREAITAARKDRAFRSWVASRGGVYLEMSQRVTPNPLLAHLPHRDVATDADQNLTLFDPATMFRQMSASFKKLGIRGSLRRVSLEPLNPENVPDDWEKGALAAFEQGAKEVSAFTDINGERHFRLMHPMKAKPKCLICHTSKTYAEGEVMGGVTFSVPMAPYLTYQRRHVGTLAATHGAIWVLGAGGMFFARRRVKDWLVKCDMTDRKIRQLSRRNELILDSAGEGIFGLDTNQRATFINAAGAWMLGYKPDEIEGRITHELFHHTKADGSPYPLSECPICGVFESNQISKGANELFWRADGSSFPIEYLSTPIVEDNEVTGAVVVFHDITERKKTEEQLKRMATLDGLTGIANRRHFMDCAEAEYHRARRFSHPLSALMLDADHFKEVNDTHGHGTGDTVLQALAATCREQIRDMDLIGRMGGEEFAILLLETDLDRACEVAERIRTAAERLSIEADTGTVSFTVSIGVAALIHDDQSFEMLIDRADKVLLDAKRDGRNRVLVDERSD